MSDERLPESVPLLLAWGLPASDSAQDFAESVGLWAAGGAGLLLWTAVALWLTA